MFAADEAGREAALPPAQQQTGRRRRVVCSEAWEHGSGWVD